MTLRYMIIGAGGTGAPLGAFLAKNGADVTLIARGAHLAAMQEKGLRFEQSDGEIWTVPVKAFDMDGFLAAKAQGAPSPDVIFVCVKGYSLDDTIPFIRSAAGEKTVVIPILNIYGTGRTMQAQLPGLLVTDGCIYISSNLAAPGVIQRHGSIFRVIFGTPDHRTDNPVLCQVAADLTAADVMRTGVVVVNQNRGIHECVSRMQHHNVDTLLVVDEALRYQGTVSIADIRLTGHVVKTIGPLVRNNTPTVGAEDNAKDCFDLLASSGFPYLVVLSPDRTVAGIITKTSMAAAMAEHLWG